jgi:hypothetical protein
VACCAHCGPCFLWCKYCSAGVKNEGQRFLQHDLELNPAGAPDELDITVFNSDDQAVLAGALRLTDEAHKVTPPCPSRLTSPSDWFLFRPTETRLYQHGGIFIGLSELPDAAQGAERGAPARQEHRTHKL